MTRGLPSKFFEMLSPGGKAISLIELLLPSPCVVVFAMKVVCFTLGNSLTDPRPRPVKPGIGEVLLP
jgi:hypothetical protein